MVQINTDPRPHEIVEDVRIGDHLGPYTFTTPYAADLLSALLEEDEDAQIVATVKAKFNWVRDGFEEDDWAEIQDALDDPTNPVRTGTIVKAYDMLSEAATKRPPTSRSASSRGPRKSTGGAKPKPKAETSGE